MWGVPPCMAGSLMILLLSVLALACDPEPSDRLGSVLRDGAVDVHPDVRLPLELGEEQGYDDDFSVVLLDEDDEPVAFADDLRWTTTEDALQWLETRMLRPDAPLIPGQAYTLLAESPARDRAIEVSFTVGEDVDRGAVPAPDVEIRSQEFIEDDPCAGPHRRLQITLDSAGFSDEATLLYLFVHMEDESPDLDGGPDALRTTIGEPLTIRYTQRMPEEEDVRSCATLFTEDATGQRSEPSTHCLDVDIQGGPQPQADGCGCASAPGPSALLSFAPFLFLVARRRSR